MSVICCLGLMTADRRPTGSTIWASFNSDVLSKDVLLQQARILQGDKGFCFSIPVVVPCLSLSFRHFLSAIENLENSQATGSPWSAVNWFHFFSISRREATDTLALNRLRGLGPGDYRITIEPFIQKFESIRGIGHVTRFAPAPPPPSLPPAPHISHLSHSRVHPNFIQ
jgi:hypothetical protein